MAQAHGDRLTAVDASFLAQEGANAHMHVGAVLIFEGPPPDYEDFCTTRSAAACTSSRATARSSRSRRWRPAGRCGSTTRTSTSSTTCATPRCRRPGSEEQLRALAARVHSQRLDRSKPLWETWLVQGLEDNRFALISKTHHALVDGVAGVDLATVLFDAEPVPPAAPHEGEPWAPAARAERGAARRARRSRGSCAPPFELGGKALGAAAHPNRSARGARARRSRASARSPGPGLNPAPETPLNVPIGPHRRFVFVRTTWRTSSASRTRSAARSTTSCSRSWPARCASWLRSRGVRTEGVELRALVPVSIRAADQHHTMGNRIAAMRGPLPVYVEDPVARLAVVRQAMDGLKDSKQAVGAEVLAGVQSFAPPTVLAQASRMNFSTRLFNLIVTNVPGPQFPLYVLGRELQDLFPIAFLPRDHALAIAIMSYNGGMDFGLLGDYDAMPDLDELGRDLEVALEELLTPPRRLTKAQGRSTAAAPRRPRPPSAGPQ